MDGRTVDRSYPVPWYPGHGYQEQELNAHAGYGGILLSFVLVTMDYVVTVGLLFSLRFISVWFVGCVLMPFCFFLESRYSK